MLHSIRTAFLDMAAANPGLRPTLLPLVRQAKKWQKMPKGWTDESRKKFWETLTGDNKHKVTKCIKRMGDKPGIDDPGAFCAALADRVMGPEWRKKPKKASHDQTPNAVDGAAARFKDHLDLKVNEHYRTAFPALVPPTLSLIHGNDFIRVVKADGGLTRQAVAFVARSTGNVYLAASWDRPRPGISANVLDSLSWRKFQLGLDTENPVNTTRPGRLAELRATRLAAFKTTRTARDLKGTLAEMFQGANQWVNPGEWGKFVKWLSRFFRSWDGNVSHLLRKEYQRSVSGKRHWSWQYNPTKWAVWKWSNVYVTDWETKDAVVEVHVTGIPSRYDDGNNVQDEDAKLRLPSAVEARGQATVSVQVLVRSFLESAITRKMVVEGGAEPMREYMLRVLSTRASTKLWSIMAQSVQNWDADDVLVGDQSLEQEVIGLVEIDPDDYEGEIQNSLQDAAVSGTGAPKVKWKASGDVVLFTIEIEGSVDWQLPQGDVNVEVSEEWDRDPY